MDDTVNTPSETSSIGEAVSGRGRGGGEGEERVSDDDDLYYIPPRRPSLELGSSPMDTGAWCFVEHAVSPVASYGTMSSEDELAMEENEDCSHTGLLLERTDSFSSCYSIESDNCEKKTLKVKSKDGASQPSDNPEEVQKPEEPLHPSYTVGFVFKTICDVLKKLPNDDLETLKWILWKCYPESFTASPRSMDILNIVDRLLEFYGLETSLKMTKALLDQMGKKGLCAEFEQKCLTNEVCYNLRETLKKKYGEVDQDLTTEGKKRPLNDLYTDVYISSNSNNGPNIEHEIMTIKKLANKSTKIATQISTKDILKSWEEENQAHSNLLFLTGVAGSGKSMAFRRLIFDWIEDQSSKFVLFPVTIRELKQFEDTQISFVDLLQKLYPETTKLDLNAFGWGSDYRLVFVIDGLDQLGEEIDFGKVEIHTDPLKATSLKVNLTSLLRGRIFNRSVNIVLCRPHVKSWVAWDMHYDEREVCGFHDPEKDEYFKKRFEDPDQASRVIEYVKSLKTLHILCHLPLFCTLVADECQHVFREKGTQAQLPSSITYMYTKLMLTLLNRGKLRTSFCEPGKESEFLMKLGQIALTMQESGEFTMIKCDWTESGMNTDKAHNCGLLTQFTVTSYVLYSERVQSFIHPTMQEYLAALYVYLSFRNQGKNIFEQQLKSKIKGIFKGPQIMELYKCAVEKSLQYEDGKLDLFLCFLFGLARKSNQELLDDFCGSPSKVVDFTESAALLLRKRSRENPERSSNLQRCLKELGV